MYILEIHEKDRRKAILLKIVNSIFKSSYESIESALTNSDFSYIEGSLDTKTEKISIKDIVDFKKSLWLKPVAGTGKLAIINNAHNLTHEAQNSLLKDLEEEPEETLIILALSNIKLVLSTILSRGIQIKEDDIYILNSNIKKEKSNKMLYNEDRQDFKYIENFLKLSAFDKFLYIDKNLSKKKNINNLSDKEDLVESFFLDLLSYYESHTYLHLDEIKMIEESLHKIRVGVNSRAVIEQYILTTKENG